MNALLVFVAVAVVWWGGLYLASQIKKARADRDRLNAIMVYIDTFVKGTGEVGALIEAAAFRRLYQAGNGTAPKEGAPTNILALSCLQLGMIDLFLMELYADPEGGSNDEGFVMFDIWARCVRELLDAGHYTSAQAIERHEWMERKLEEQGYGPPP